MGRALHHLVSQSQQARRVALVFDAWEGCGLGHFARMRALGSWLEQVVESECALVPLGRMPQEPLAQEVAKAQGVVSQIASDGLRSELEGLFDAIVLDTYQRDLQTLEWLQGWQDRGRPTTVALWCDTPWSGLASVAQARIAALIDPTFCLEDASPDAWHGRRLGGPTAVVLNSSEPSPSLPTGPCVALGASVAAEQQLHDVLDALPGAGWPKSPDVMTRGSRFGWARTTSAVEERPVRDILRDAEMLVVGAGQMIWEAADVRSTFWITALTHEHENVIARLIRYGALKRRRAVGRLVEVEVPPQTKSALAQGPVKLVSLLFGSQKTSEVSK